MAYVDQWQIENSDFDIQDTKALQGMAIIQEDPTATRTIAAGKYVFWNRIMYMAITDISVGTAFEVGTNLIAVPDGGFNNFIDDTAGEGDTTNVWSADKTYAESEKQKIYDVKSYADIVTFPDGADDVPLKQMKVKLEPVQDLHGYDNPWPGGGGKNLVDLDSYSLTVPASTAITQNIVSVELTQGVTYVFSCRQKTTLTQNGRNTLYISRNGNYAYEQPVVNYHLAIGTHSMVFTASETGAYWLGFWGSGTNVDSIYDQFMLEVASAFTSYAPYSNICPITGFDEVEVKRTGKNLFDKNDVETNLMISTDGTIASQSNTVLSDYILIDYNPITISAINVNPNKSSSYSSIRIGFYDENKNFIERVTTGNPIEGNTKYKKSFSQYAKYVRVNYFIYDFLDSAQNADIQLELGETATEYEPFGETYLIQLPTEAGTVYGGELTVNRDGTGTLVVDRARVLIDSFTAVAELDGFRTTSVLPGITGGYGPLKCNMFSRASDYTEAVRAIKNAIGYNYQGVILLNAYVNGAYVNNVNDLNALVQAAGGCEIVYPIATPITYTLSAPQIRTLLGVNNIWADAGQTGVTYPADTKLYIDGKLAELQALILENINNA